MESSSSSAAATSEATHTSRGLWGAVAGTAAVAAIATVVIVSANFGDPEPSAGNVGVAPSTSGSAAPTPQPSPGASASAAPSTSATPTKPSGQYGGSGQSSGSGQYGGSGQSGTSLDEELDDLPSIPPVEDELLGELPSIGALPTETEAPDEEPPAATEEPAPSPGDGQDPGSPTSTSPSEPNSPSETTAPPQTAEPASPAVTPSAVNAQSTAGTYTSEPVTITHQGEVAYQQVQLRIPSFGTGPFLCSVTVDDGSGTVTSSAPEPCGDAVAELDILIDGAELAVDDTITFTINITPGTDAVVPEFIDLDLTTTAVGSSEPLPTDEDAVRLTFLGATADGSTEAAPTG